MQTIRYFRVVLVICAALAVGATSAQSAPAKTEEKRVERFDIRYHTGSRHKLDIIAPGGKKNLPVVLVIHGGTWMYGDKNFFGLYREFGRFLAQQGFVAVLANYRLSPMTKHPGHVKDVARAFAWVHRHIGKHGGDPDRIVLCGHSAGGHLVTLLATDKSYLNDPKLKLTANDRAALRGVIGVSGVYRVPVANEFRDMLKCMVESLVGDARSSGMAKLLSPMLFQMGKLLNPFNLVFGTDQKMCAKASPLTHVHKGLPPFLLLYAEREVPGLDEMAGDFAAALKKYGNTVTIKEIESRNHRTILFNAKDKGDTAGKMIAEFVRKTAGKPLKGAGS